MQIKIFCIFSMLVTSFFIYFLISYKVSSVTRTFFLLFIWSTVFLFCPNLDSSHNSIVLLLVLLYTLSYQFDAHFADTKHKFISRRKIFALLWSWMRPQDLMCSCICICIYYKGPYRTLARMISHIVTLTVANEYTYTLSHFFGVIVILSCIFYSLCSVVFFYFSANVNIPSAWNNKKWEQKIKIEDNR